MTDFSIAFDLVDHTIVIRKIYSLGAREELLSWLASFRIHKQATRVSLKAHGSGQYSSWPQSTMLFRTKPSPNRNNYVDDLTIADSRLSPLIDICQALQELETWRCESNMKPNPSKCHCLQVFFSKNPARLEPIIICGQPIRMFEDASLSLKFAISPEKIFSHLLPQRRSELRALRFSEIEVPHGALQEKCHPLLRLLNSK